MFSLSLRVFLLFFVIIELVDVTKLWHIHHLLIYFLIYYCWSSFVLILSLLLLFPLLVKILILHRSYRAETLNNWHGLILSLVIRLVLGVFKVLNFEQALLSHKVFSSFVFWLKYMRKYILNCLHRVSFIAQILVAVIELADCILFVSLLKVTHSISLIIQPLINKF